MWLRRILFLENTSRDGQGAHGNPGINGEASVQDVAEGKVALEV